MSSVNHESNTGSFMNVTPAEPDAKGSEEETSGTGTNLSEDEEKMIEEALANWTAVPDFDVIFPDDDMEQEKRRLSEERGFVFFPSHLRTYEMLKQGGDTALALEFLEALIYYGVRGIEDYSDNIYVKCLMENITPVIDKNYEKYCRYKSNDTHRKSFNIDDHSVMTPEDMQYVMSEIIMGDKE